MNNTKYSIIIVGFILLFTFFLKALMHTVRPSREEEEEEEEEERKEERRKKEGRRQKKKKKMMMVRGV